MKQKQRKRMRKVGLLKCGVDICAALGFSATYMAALRHAMGLSGKSRYMDLDSVRRWVLEHPEFKVRDVYPRNLPTHPQPKEPINEPG